MNGNPNIDEKDLYKKHMDEILSQCSPLFKYYMKYALAAGVAIGLLMTIGILKTNMTIFYLLACYLLITLRPQTREYIIPLSIIFLFYLSGEYGNNSGIYSPSEWEMCLTASIFAITYSVPHKLNYSGIAFFIGISYKICHTYYGYQTIPFSFIASAITTLTYYSLSSFKVHAQFEVLYKMIASNELLIDEMRRLIETFPSGVFIQTVNNLSEKTNSMSNQQFKDNIINIHDNIENLEKVNVVLKHNNEDFDTLNYENLNLLELLKIHQQHCDNNGEYENADVILELDDSFQNVGYESNNNDKSSSNRRRFCIKTRKVNWEGDPNSYMHVFIDTTDILKLEQAKHNIKLQKTMFTSTSHEFRTPLNAIINSFRFIDDIYSNLCKKLKMSQNQTDSIQI